MGCDNIERINNQKKCYILGPTGPTGPIGPTGPQGIASARISVESTKTLDPNEQANVYNSGTESDVLLNFEIPRGSTGPVAKFIIGSVNTTEPGTPAQVTINPIYKDREE